VHRPYEPSAPYRALFTGPDGDGDRVAAAVPARYRANLDAYDQGIRELDDLVAGFVSGLDRLGLGERTLVVLLSDHGEAFGEHALVGHGYSPHEEALRVPLVLRGPGVPGGRRVTTPVSLTDVAPTLLDLLDLAPLPEAQGRSLEDAIRERPLLPRPSFFEWLVKDTRGVRWGPWKFLQRGRHGNLFNLAADPAERSPARTLQVVTKTLEHHLAAYVADGSARRGALQSVTDGGGERMPISAETERSLRALGYLR